MSHFTITDDQSRRDLWLDALGVLSLAVLLAAGLALPGLV